MFDLFLLVSMGWIIYFSITFFKHRKAYHESIAIITDEQLEELKSLRGIIERLKAIKNSSKEDLTLMWIDAMVAIDNHDRKFGASL